MTFLNKLYDRLMPPAVPSDTPMISVPAHVILRPQKWVMVQGEIGIVSQILSGDQIIVDMVNAEDGTTIKRRQVSVALCALARWDQIPECRKVGFSKEEAARIGYI
jgi:hypothetical protein